MRATARITGVARNTIDKLLVELGEACSRYQDATLRNLSCKHIQVDECWAFSYCKQKQVTNVRSANSEIDERLTPATRLSLEQSLDFLSDDELLEVTPKTLRIRKRLLDPNERARARKDKVSALAGVS